MADTWIGQVFRDHVQTSLHHLEFPRMGYKKSSFIALGLGEMCAQTNCKWWVVPCKNEHYHCTGL